MNPKYSYTTLNRDELCLAVAVLMWNEVKEHRAPGLAASFTDNKYKVRSPCACFDASTELWN